jgi:hypothetical protein
MFHLIVEVKFSIDKAHVTDMYATTKTGCRVRSHLTRRKLKITYKKRKCYVSVGDACMYAVVGAK